MTQRYSSFNLSCSSVVTSTSTTQVLPSVYVSILKVSSCCCAVHRMLTFLYNKTTCSQQPRPCGRSRHRGSPRGAGSRGVPAPRRGGPRRVSQSRRRYRATKHPLASRPAAPARTERPTAFPTVRGTKKRKQARCGRSSVPATTSRDALCPFCQCPGQCRVFFFSASHNQ